MNEYQQFVIEVIELNSNNQLTLDDFKNIKRDFAKRNKLSDIPTNIKLLRVYHQLLKSNIVTKNLEIESLFKKRSVRSESGIVAIQVLTKPYPCPGKCIFCPNEKWMPKSYISTEPGAMRAALNQFDPIKQAYNRLLSLTMTGHQTDKIEMIVLWWTRDAYPRDYKIEFIKKLYDACNTFSDLEIDLPDENKPTKKLKIFLRKLKYWFKWHKYISEKRFQYDITNLNKIKYSSSLEEAIKINETAVNRIIGLTTETRPEFITDENCKFRRELWITRLEIWVQSMYDDILKANKRWHTVQQIRDGIHKLRQYWFKFSIHIMPWLYKSDYKKDLWTFQKIYTDPFLKPDEIKFYPTSVIPNTKLYDLYKSWEYTPINTEYIQKLIKETFQEIIPPYTRIKRLIRDIPATEIAAGSNITNLAQLTHNELQKEFRSDTKKAQVLYARLYWDYKLFSTVEEFLQHCHCEPAKQSISRKPLNTGLLHSSQWQVDTYIIWKEPDTKTYRNFITLDTRSREIRQKSTATLKKGYGGDLSESVNLIIRKYYSSVWIEYFISFEDLQWYLYGFARLLLPKKWETIQRDWLGQNTAIIRELHIYGQLASLQWNNVDDTQKQHKWFGSQLMSLAEKISKKAKYNRLSVISGIWVRWYYQKIWYSLEWTYMIKKL